MKKLVQFRFEEKGIQIIENLKQKLDFSSRAEVMRLALNLLNWAIEYIENGYEITAIKSSNKNIEDKPIDKLFILNIIKGGKINDC